MLYEDADLFAVDKQPGDIVVRGREGKAEPSLLDKLAKARKEKLYIVHRLDRGTSGVLIFARNEDSHRVLNEAFEEGWVDKRYFVLVAGVPTEDEFTVDVALLPARRGKMKPAVKADKGAKKALTRFKVLERFERFALLEAKPETGRTHQIRVHLKYAGFPLAVDGQYSSNEKLTRGDLGSAPAELVVLDRTPLHAASITLRHPKTKAPLKIDSPLPADLEKVLALLRVAVTPKT